jgi:hypothetical protein
MLGMDAGRLLIVLAMIVAREGEIVKGDSSRASAYKKR